MSLTEESQIPTWESVGVPDTDLTDEVAAVLRRYATPLVVAHSYRVYHFAAGAGIARGLPFDPELLFVAAAFHDLGLTPPHSSADLRFEVDGANAARDFLTAAGVEERGAELVWQAIALHTTPGIPQFMAPEVALLTAGVEADVLGLGLGAYPKELVDHIVAAHPRTGFKAGIIQAFSDGIAHKPQTTFGNVKADVLARTTPHFRRTDFTDLILQSPLPE